MREHLRTLVAVGLLFGRGTVLAQEPRPTELPPLLPTPAAPPARSPVSTLPASIPGRAAVGEYDPSYSYLPERLPAGSRQPPCPCRPRGKWWAGAAYLHGTTEAMQLPTLVTAGGTVLNPVNLESSFRPGLRLDAGHWLDRCNTFGVEGSFLFLSADRPGFQVASPGAPALSRPFLNTATGVPDFAVLTDSGPGSLTLSTDSFLIGGDVNGRWNLWCEDHARLDGLAGYRTFRLDETLSIQARRNNEQTMDRFRTENHFHAAQVGLFGEWRWDGVFVDAFGKAALGGTWRAVELEGATGPGGGPGFLVRPTNAGRTTAVDFAVLSEAGLMVGYQAAEHWRIFAGYTLLYVSLVARPGDQIDLSLSPAGGTIGNRPARREATTDFWLQGVTLGLEVRF